MRRKNKKNQNKTCGLQKIKKKKKGLCKIVCLCIDIFLCMYSILSNHHKPFSATGESVFSCTKSQGRVYAAPHH